MKLDPNIIRQGDVIMVYRDNVPEAAPVVELGQEVVLSFSEVTGHRHVIVADRPAVKAPSKPVFDASAERHLRLLDDGKLSHEEHTIAIMRPGCIELGQQVEAGPGNMLRRVAD